MTRTILLIHHSHTDVGYTETQQRIERWQVDFLRQATAIAERRPDFRWVCETFWPVERFLAHAADEDRERFVAQVRAGRIGLSSNYLNLSELAGPEVLDDICARAAVFGEEIQVPVRCAMTADINGCGWGFAQALHDAGTRCLMTCVHTHHGRYPLDRPQQGFWWETPRGDRLLTWSGEHYHFGNELGLAPGACSSYLTKDDCDADMIFHDHRGVAERRIPRYWERLEQEGHPFSFVPVMVSGLRTDNGPPSEAVLDAVERWNEAHGARYRVEMATLETFFDRLAEEGDGLPTYRGDWPDWWSDGPSSMPRGVRLFRAAQRDLRRARTLRAARVDGADRDTVTQLALFAEHTFGHSESISQPWHPLAESIAARKEAYASQALEQASTLLEAELARSGEACLEPALPLRWRVLNATNAPISGLAAPEVIHHEYADRSVDDAVRVRVVDTDDALAFDRQPVPRGMAFLVPVTLAPGEHVDLELVPSPGAAPEVTDRPAEVSHAVLETDFTRIELDDERGIARWQDADGKDLLHCDAAHAPFQLLRELTPCEDPEQMLAVRGAMGLDRRGRDARLAAARVRLLETQCGTVRSLARIHYDLAGCAQSVLEIAIPHHAPRADVSLRFHKLGCWAPENLYAPLPFTAGPHDALWVGKPGCVLRPWTDQLPGTLTDFTCVDEGLAWTGATRGVAVALVDQPLVHLGVLEPGRRLLSADPRLPDRPRHVHAWLMNNFWETNFVADLGGFHQFRYVVTWGTALADPQVAIDRTRALALDLTTIRLGAS